MVWLQAAAQHAILIQMGTHSEERYCLTRAVFCAMIVNAARAFGTCS